MSELSLGTLSGLAANSYVVDVAAGSSLDLSNATGLPASALPTGSVLQVVSTTKTDTFQSSATSWTDVTGLEVSITPRSTSSKILITASVAASPDNADNAGMSLKLVGGNASGYVGDAAGSRIQGVYGMFNDTGTANLYLSLLSFSFEYLDSPNSTSTQTYKIQMIGDGSGFSSINSSTGDGDSTEYTRGASTITVMEVAG
jgi:hypothetical protein